VYRVFGKGHNSFKGPFPGRRGVADGGQRDGGRARAFSKRDGSGGPAAPASHETQHL